jgi:tetratricopeptide (TPR) repeat protein
MTIGKRLCCCAVGMLALISPALGATRLFIDSRPTNLDPKDPICRLIHREIPRQALIVAATEDLGVICIDPTIEPTAAAREGDIQIGLDRKVHEDHFRIDLMLFNAHNIELQKVAIEEKPNEQNVVQYDDYAEKVDELIRTKWEKIVAAQMGVAVKETKWDATLPAPPGVEQLLGTIDFQHAFLAARLTHLAIADSGESPARLGALVRAYANLGDATRHLIAGQSVGFFARSLMYAQRLVRLAPDDSASWEHRAYAEALFGNPLAARGDLEHAKDLGDKSPPSWVELIHDLVLFKTVALFDKANDPLASYFAWLDVEHSLLPSVTINFGRLALEQNPGAVRVMDSLIANSGVGLNHQQTMQSTLVLNRLVATLAKDSAAPVEIQNAVQRTMLTRFSVPAILQLLKTMDALPAENGVPLQWSTFASLVRECQFSNCIRRLNFVTHEWGVDPTEEREQWLDVLGDHRYADFIRSYESIYHPPTPELVEKVRRINFKDDALSADIFFPHILEIGLEKDPRRDIYWSMRHFEQASNSTYDLASGIWEYRFDDRPNGGRDYRRQAARTLLSICPNHPIGIAERLMDDWPEMKPQAEQIERDLSESPIVLYALGCGYTQDKQYDKAVRLLEQAVQLAPDQEVYRQLATVRLAQNDEEGWLKTWEKYLQVSEDFGLDHAKIGEEIATHFISKGEYDRALPYAKSAAETGSAWGFLIYARALTKLGKYDEAAGVLEENAERYADPTPLYTFCRATGHGDVAAAMKLFQQRIPEFKNSQDPNVLCDLGLYDYLENQPDEAAKIWTQAGDLGKLRFYPLLTAMVQLNQSKIDDAKKSLSVAADWPMPAPRDKAYAACIAEMQRCLNDPTVLPARDGEIGKILASNDLAVQRGNICFILGRICELRNHNDDAKWWYRQSLDSDAEDFTCRAMSAVALRKLGEEYFK